MLIHDCIAREGHGLLGLGTEFAGSLRNIVMRDCRAEGTQMGLRFKSNTGNGGVMENVLAENIEMVDVAHPIRFRLRNFYPDGLPPEYVQGPAATSRSATSRPPGQTSAAAWWPTRTRPSTMWSSTMSSSRAAWDSGS
ncbi:MAG: glycosyl hydrolase family 28 protein [Planctomycetota bacterium]